MRVLIVSGIWPPDVGGPASHAPDVAQFLQDRGHEVEVVTTSDAPPAVRPYPVRAVPRHHRLGVRHLRGRGAHSPSRARGGHRLHDRHVRPQRCGVDHGAKALRREAHRGSCVRAITSPRLRRRQRRRLPGSRAVALQLRCCASRVTSSYGMPHMCSHQVRTCESWRSDGAWLLTASAFCRIRRLWWVSSVSGTSCDGHSV